MTPKLQQALEGKGRFLVPEAYSLIAICLSSALTIIWVYFSAICLLDSEIED